MPMLLRDNPVLIRELLVNLRSPRAFVLQFAYVAFLGAGRLLRLAGRRGRGDQVSAGRGAAAVRPVLPRPVLPRRAGRARPSPRGASPARRSGRRTRCSWPARSSRSTILVGKLLSSLTYLVLLILSSLPLMILCFLLGGILLSEIARAYLILILAAGTFGLLSVACSSYFSRTSSALVVSYLSSCRWRSSASSLTRTENTDAARLRLDRRPAAVVPGDLDRRGDPRQPPPAPPAGRRQRGEGGRRRGAGDEVRHRRRHRPRPLPRQAVRPGQAHRPDARRHQPGARQGAAQRDLQPGDADAPRGDPGEHAPVDPPDGGPAVLPARERRLLRRLRARRSTCWSARSSRPGSITQERERQTLGLLLTTLLRPGKIVFAKLLAALRVSTVLTFLLTEQLLLAYVLIPELRDRFWTLLVFLAIIATTCLATSTIGLLCSALSRQTSVAMVLTYMTLLVLFVGAGRAAAGTCRGSPRRSPRSGSRP